MSDVASLWLRGLRGLGTPGFCFSGDWWDEQRPKQSNLHGTEAWRRKLLCVNLQTGGMKKPRDGGGWQRLPMVLLLLSAPLDCPRPSAGAGYAGLQLRSVSAGQAKC